MSKSDINYTYSKVRKNFGGQPMFSFVSAHFLDFIMPDQALHKTYCLRNPVHHESQASTSQKEHYVNTKRVVHKDQGVNHSEGGWPKEISFADEEATIRYRRRYERDDSYVDAVLGAYHKFEKYINQNNAIELYNMYFTSMPSITSIENTKVQINNVYRDKYRRPIGSLDWTSENEPKLVASYCDKKYPRSGPVNSKLSCLVWNLEISSYPESKFLPPTTCWQVACSPISPAVIVGGLEDGRVCVFDIRMQRDPVSLSPMHLAHRDPVTALVYMQTRSNNEFFSGSTDGCCMWWDIRNISNPTDSLMITVKLPPKEQPSLANSEPVSTLQFEKSIPTRFMCGTDTGLVVNVNRKGKSLKEMMTGVFEAHLGPVKAIHRSPCTSKMFITCGDRTVHIWSDDIFTSPIVTGLPNRYQINDVAWAPQRVSSYMSVSADGKFRYWDLLRKYSGPIKTLLVSKSSLTHVKPHQKGRLIALGDDNGGIFLMTLSNNLVISGKHDKQLMIQLYERESRREHILESRVKEIRLKQAIDDKPIGVPIEVIDDEFSIRAVEEEYRRVVNDALRQVGGMNPTTPMRQR